MASDWQSCTRLVTASGMQRVSRSNTVGRCMRTAKLMEDERRHAAAIYFPGPCTRFDERDSHDFAAGITDHPGREARRCAGCWPKLAALAVPQSDTATLPCGGSAEWLSIFVTKGVRHHLRGVEVVNGSVVSWCVVRRLPPVAT